MSDYIFEGNYFLDGQPVEPFIGSFTCDNRLFLDGKLAFEKASKASLFKGILRRSAQTGLPTLYFATTDTHDPDVKRKFRISMPKDFTHL